MAARGRMLLQCPFSCCAVPAVRLAARGHSSIADVLHPKPPQGRLAVRSLPDRWSAQWISRQGCASQSRYLRCSITAGVPFRSAAPPMGWQACCSCACSCLTPIPDCQRRALRDQAVQPSWPCLPLPAHSSQTAHTHLADTGAPHLPCRLSSLCSSSVPRCLTTLPLPCRLP